ncbi:MAG: hypothetical protein LBH28_01315, partial [Oscillospiraceae bacterium]|nr:hypothetical protein [Oscillospiraceae bacterium]
MKKFTAVVITLLMMLTLTGPAAVTAASETPTEIKFEGAPVSAFDSADIPLISDSPIFDLADSLVGRYSITYSESGYADVVEYDAYRVSYVKNPQSSNASLQTLNIMVPTRIRTVAYDASDSPILFINGSDGYAPAAAPAPTAGNFSFS